MIGFKNNWNQFIEQGRECINELKNKKTRKKQIPNILTASRLLSPFFLIPTALTGNLLLTGIFTGMFALTDAFDGYFARKFNASSEFGRKLDPITDKVFAGSLLIPLAVFNPLILINILGEVIISISSVKSQILGKEPHTVFLGKIKTTFLYTTIALSYLTLAVSLNNSLVNFLISFTAMLQGASFIKYNYPQKIENNNEPSLIINESKNIPTQEMHEQKEKKLDPKKISDWKVFRNELLKSKSQDNVKETIKQKKKNRPFN